MDTRERRENPQSREGFQRRIITTFYQHTLEEIGRAVFVEHDATSFEEAQEILDGIEGLTSKQRIRMEYGVRVLVSLVGQNVSLREVREVKLWQNGPEPTDIEQQVTLRPQQH